jgi:hypothetical protein
MSPPSNAARVSRRRLNQALLCPKPTGTERVQFLAGYGRRGLGSRERQALQHIAAHADLIDRPLPWTVELGDVDAWLLVPAPKWLVDELAAFEAERAELEADDAGEEDDHAEDSDADEDDGTAEPEIEADREPDSSPEMWGEA